MEAVTHRAAAQQPPVPPVPGSSSGPGPSSFPGSSSAPGSSYPSDFQAFISSELRAQFQDYQTWVEQRLSQISAEHAAYREEMDSRYQGLRNDMSHFADSMRYMDLQFGAIYMKYNMRGPDPTAFARPLPPSGPPFPVRAHSAPPAPEPSIAAIDLEEEASDEDDDDDDDEDVEMAAGDAEDDDDEEDDDEDDDDEE